MQIWFATFLLFGVFFLIYCIILEHFEASSQTVWVLADCECNNFQKDFEVSIKFNVKKMLWHYDLKMRHSM